MNWGNLIATLFGALPTWIMAVEALHGSGNGATKKAAVQALAGSTLNVVAGADPKLAPQLQIAGPAIGTAIDGVVSTLNAFGVLNGSNTPAPSAPAATPAPATPQLVASAPAVVTATPQAQVATAQPTLVAPAAPVCVGGYKYGVPAHS